MTQREKQLLRWIEENPLVSQQALAERAGITRSSVGVHISNLMKQGYIAGRGYVLPKAACAAVWLHAPASDSIVRAEPPGDPSVVNTAHMVASLRVRMERG